MTSWQELHAAIEASLQDNPAFPPDGCLDDDGDRHVGRRKGDMVVDTFLCYRGRSENIYSHYTDSLRVAQDIGEVVILRFRFLDENFARVSEVLGGGSQEGASEV